MTNIIVIVLTVGLLGWALFVARDLLRSRRWHTAIGTVIQSRVESTTVPSSIFLRNRPRIIYRYRVNGISFIGSRFSIGPLLHNWPPYVASLVRQYPVGKQVAVFHDPREPQQSCLKRQGWEAVVIMVLVALIGLVITQIPGWAG